MRIIIGLLFSLSVFEYLGTVCSLGYFENRRAYGRSRGFERYALYPALKQLMENFSYKDTLYTHLLYQAATHYGNIGREMQEGADIAVPFNLGTLLHQGVQPFVFNRRLMQPTANQTIAIFGEENLQGENAGAVPVNVAVVKPHLRAPVEDPYLFNPRLSPLQPELRVPGTKLKPSDFAAIARLLPPGSLPANPTPNDVGRALERQPAEILLSLVRQLPSDTLERILTATQNGGIGLEDIFNPISQSRVSQGSAQNMINSHGNRKIMMNNRNQESSGESGKAEISKDSQRIHHGQFITEFAHFDPSLFGRFEEGYQQTAFRNPEPFALRRSFGRQNNGGIILPRVKVEQNADITRKNWNHMWGTAVNSAKNLGMRYENVAQPRWLRQVGSMA